MELMRNLLLQLLEPIRMLCQYLGFTDGVFLLKVNSQVWQMGPGLTSWQVEKNWGKLTSSNLAERERTEKWPSNDLKIQTALFMRLFMT